MTAEDESGLLYIRLPPPDGIRNFVLILNSPGFGQYPNWYSNFDTDSGPWLRRGMFE